MRIITGLLIQAKNHPRFPFGWETRLTPLFEPQSGCPSEFLGKLEEPTIGNPFRHMELKSLGLRSRNQYSNSPTPELPHCELSKMRLHIPSMSSVSEIGACPPSPIADHTSALPSPNSSLSSSEKFFLSVHSMPTPVGIQLDASCCTLLLSFSMYCKIKIKKNLFLYVLFV